MVHLSNGIYHVLMSTKYNRIQPRGWISETLAKEVIILLQSYKFQETA